MERKKYFNINNVEWKKMDDGIRYCIFQPDPNATIQYTEVPIGVTLLAHKHEAAQITYVQSGFLKAEIDGEISTLGPGSICYIPSNAEHSVRNIGQVTCVALDVFLPGRSDRAESEQIGNLTHLFE